MNKYKKMEMSVYGPVTFDCATIHDLRFRDRFQGDDLRAALNSTVWADNSGNIMMLPWGENPQLMALQYLIVSPGPWREVTLFVIYGTDASWILLGDANDPIDDIARGALTKRIRHTH